MLIELVVQAEQTTHRSSSQMYSKVGSVLAIYYVVRYWAIPISRPSSADRGFVSKGSWGGHPISDLSARIQ